MFNNELKDVTTRGAIVAIALGLILVAVVLGTYVFRSNRLVAADDNQNSYQAVVLRNGQVYFGHLQNLGSAYVNLTDVYYIKNEQGQGAASPAATPGGGLTLVTLGDEIPQPEQEMFIAADQIVYYETMKDDSKVAEAIKKAKAEKK